MIPGIVASSVATVASFAPTDIAGLHVWLDATQMGLNNDDLVTTWSDLSGGNRHATQATTAKKPQYKTGIINGKAIVRFNGADATDDNLAFATNMMSGVSAATVFIVIKIDTDPPAGIGTSGLWVFGSDTTSTHYPYSDGVIYDSFGTTARKTTGNPTPALTSPRIYCVVTAASDWRSYLDGTLHYSTATNTVGWYSVPKIGNNQYATGATAFLDGDVGEFILYNSALSTGDRQAVETYLKAKWGIA